MRHFSLILVVTISTLLTACSTTTVDSASVEELPLSLDSDLFGERPSIISTSEIHELSDEQRLAFRRYFNDPENQDTAPHKRVYNYLESITTGFSYLGETYTASVALEQGAGNCLALAILTTGLAKLADIDVDYQLIDSAPVFESRGNIIRRSLHVRSMLLDPTWETPEGHFILSPPGIRIDYFPSKYSRFIRNIDESEYFAMYYRNIAGDAIEDQDLSKAYWLLMESLELSPASPESLNMLAIVFDRAGDKNKSDEIYRYGIQHADRRVSLLRNYGIFLRREGRDAEADEVDATLARQSDPNPFDWIYAGQEAYEGGDFRRAIGLFNKSVQLAPYLHEGHFGLARAYLQLGNTRRAEHELEQALTKATGSTTRRLYEAKLAALGDSRSR
jgi:Flp pilus assembly protein TadD